MRGKIFGLNAQKAKVDLPEDLAFLKDLSSQDMSTLLRTDGSLRDRIIAKIMTLEGLSLFLSHFSLEQASVFSSIMLIQYEQKNPIYKKDIDKLADALSEEQGRLVRHIWKIIDAPFGPAIIQFLHGSELVFLQMPPEDVINFMEGRVNGYTCVTYAAHRHPKAVATILKSIPPELLGRVMTQTTEWQRRTRVAMTGVPEEGGYNALMLAARYNPEIVTTILDATPKEVLSRVMTRTTILGGWNALMLAVSCQPQVVVSILKAIPDNALSSVMAQTTTEGDNALMLAALHHPELVPLILRRMPNDVLVTMKEHPILQQKISNVPDNAVYIEIKIAIELAALEQKLRLFQTLDDAHEVTSRFSVANRLYHNLHQQFMTYLDSKKDNTALLILATCFEAELTKPENKILSVHRSGFWRICQVIADAVSRLLGAKESHHDSNFFKKTDTAAIQANLRQLAEQPVYGSEDNNGEVPPKFN